MTSMTLSPSKPALRTQALAKRDGLPADVRASASHAVAGHVARGALQVGGATVSLYHAIGAELDPALLAEALVDAGATLALPVLLYRDTMVFRGWDRGQALVPVGFGTLGPDHDQPEVVPDLVVAPLAAFSSAGQRIGYGKGHYDRALAKLKAQGRLPAYLGLAFDEQGVPPFEDEPHDIRLDGVLTPSGLQFFPHGQDRMMPFLPGGSAATPGL